MMPSVATLTRGTLLCGLIAASIPPALTAGHQEDGLVRARTLYESAQYEDALVALQQFQSAEAIQYRTLCLLALGRAPEAEGLIASLVRTHPTFVPDADVPPRFAALFSKVYRSVLPEVARDASTQGRERFRAKAYDEARRHFQLVITLTSGPPFRDDGTLADLRTVAGGFLDLIEGMNVSAPPPAPPPRVEEKPAAVARSVPQSEIVPASAIRQTVPPWPTSSLGEITAPVTGALRVWIDTDGKVTRAAIVTSLHPQYDPRLLRAARSWLYQPARLNGQPVAVDKLVAVVVKPE